MKKRGNDSFDADWKNRLLAGDRAALARAITAVENRTTPGRMLLKEIYPEIGRALVVGFTGAPGVGKSTLVNAYVSQLRDQGKSVGVIAVDPSSPYSGGAILGDRVRMSSHGGDDGVFIRSLATRGHQGGLSQSAAWVVDVMDAAGKEVIIVETVGAGQSEVEIAHLAHTKVVVTAPGLGDEIQALKAGIIEIADILVVNKCDLPQAEQTANHLREAIDLSPREGWQAPVLEATAIKGEGLKELAETIEKHAAQLPPDFRELGSRMRTRKLIAAAATQKVNHLINSLPVPSLEALCEAVMKGEIDFEEAAEKALALIFSPYRQEEEP